MQDLALDWGGDLALGPTGDLALASGDTLGQQRVLRRLLTNAGGYIWNLGYGAGLGQCVGTPASAARIQAVIRSQIFAEPQVASQPEPVIAVTADAGGAVYVQLRYTDAGGGTQLLSFSPGD